MAIDTPKAATKVTLPSAIFGITVENHELLKLAYDSYLANSRQASATTLKRGEVRGGGKKPWRQKGTGRARFGSTRNPIWRGGGVVFGPSGNENYTKKISTGSKRVAVKQALSLANKAKKIVVKGVKTTGKTSEIAKFLADNKFARRTLIVVDEKTPELLRATKNLQNVLLVRSTYLSVYHILNADHIVLSPASIKTIEAWLGGDK
ncbi:MAG TPA: 50S ribosomal protein L4 [Candidatus Saccharibacteria bacterium]|nr:50S ribosomal protein L4 [Candidatus Saccharibacteria bacterium]HRK94651.1 50S ribosomal protein L4 [Candidatus Saccharibacteria bacterium]